MSSKTNSKTIVDRINSQVVMRFTRRGSAASHHESSIGPKDSKRVCKSKTAPKSTARMMNQNQMRDNVNLHLMYVDGRILSLPAIDVPPGPYTVE
ncbi:hypothetical protein AVEN_46171-1 [Araneus ventricosus]|uniref:Uncharacterized protein n=1 Tax=Araneus ventricosus TaxID=182803 RepID=A0A4Y2RGL3_ARAVE|nr:hypothetical protein AVEN_46171-1 [Araneus ventricosus]